MLVLMGAINIFWAIIVGMLFLSFTKGLDSILSASLKQGFFLALALLFFVVVFWGTIHLFWVHFSAKPGLVIHQKGIEGIKRWVGIHFVPWQDIVEIKKHQIPSHKKGQPPTFVFAVVIKNPEEYLRKTQFPWTKWRYQRNIRLYETPLVISNHYLDIKVEHLHNLLQQTLEIYQEND